MARYAVEHIWEGKQEYFLIRDHQSWQMVLFPSKYLTHLIRANRSPMKCYNKVVTEVANKI